MRARGYSQVTSRSGKRTVTQVIRATHVETSYQEAVCAVPFLIRWEESGAGVFFYIWLYGLRHPVAFKNLPRRAKFKGGHIYFKTSK